MSRAWKILGIAGRAVQLAVFMLVFAVLSHELLGPHVNGEEAARGRLAAAILGALFGVLLFVINLHRDK
jgi:hypothetical protein